MAVQQPDLSPLVQYERIDHVVIITLNRSDRRNAFNAALTRAVAEALRRFDEDDGARVAILTGAGPCFSSGADVRERQCRTVEEFKKFGGPQEPDANSRDLLTRAIRWKPVIAAVHGVVMGLAVGVALECELVVAEAATRFQITETPRGLGGARYWGLMHFAGAGTFATEVALTGRFFTAEEAYGAGLISRIVPKGEHVAVALELARQIAVNPPLSVRATVRSRRWFMSQLEREIAVQSDPLALYLTNDFREAVQAYLDKRPLPPFTGT